MAYQLRFTATDEPREMELYLCQDCLGRLCAEPDVDLVAAATGQASPDAVHPE